MINGTCEAFDGTKVPCVLKKMKCGGTPIFDQDTGYAYRCDTCYAILGSIGQSNYCKNLNKEEVND